jgi:hypothetical protein
MNHVNIRIPSDKENLKEYIREIWMYFGSATEYVLTGELYAPLFVELEIPHKVSEVQGNTQFVFVKNEEGQVKGDIKY